MEKSKLVYIRGTEADIISEDEPPLRRSTT